MYSIAPKILIAAPQSDIKNYCFLDWVLNIKKFDYPQDRIDIFLVDSSDTKENYEYIKSLGIKAKYVPKNGRGIIETMAECHQICLDYARDNNYDYLLHLETDIFPKKDILEGLITAKKPIVCGLYNIFDGAYREPMIRLVEPKNSGYVKAYGVKPYFGDLLDGKLLKVFSGALGCTLINAKLFHRIKFRWVKGQNQFPDTWFAQDMYMQNIPIYVSTKNFCEHKNISWGTYKLNFK